MTDHDHPDTHGTADDTWHPSPAQLAGHLEDQLPAEESARIDEHLDGCARCVAALDALESPAVLPRTEAADASEVDARWMRRSVRRTLLRTALNAAGLLLIGALGLQLLGALVFNPLFVERGDRVAQSVTASIDLPIMTIPGAEIRDVRSNPGILRRTTVVDVERPVGARAVRLGDYEARIGPVGMSPSAGPPTLVGFGPRLSEQPTDRSVVAFEPERLGEGTAVTVQLAWEDGRTPDEANAVADAADDLALLWVGFGTPGSAPAIPGGHLGYGACHTVSPFIEETLTSGFVTGGFGTSGGFRAFPPEPGNGAQHALEQLRRATTNLAATGWLDTGTGEGPLDDVAATATWLEDNDPDVLSVVLTGPTQAVAAAVEASDADTAGLLEVDFDRGAPQECG
ncbi:MAG: zf-HC2 domain-containing protein [Nitriliruptoraceae bacterium]|nr:zf-HC2 domain-containing protein [Nitriliruptoraceae bacterium]